MRLTGYAAVLLLLLAGCAAGPATRLGELPLATPRQAALQDEVAAVRIGQFLDAAERDESEMAMLFYQRGLYFSRLGLDWLAHVDFRRAVELRPDFAEAYNQLGVQFTLMGQFDSAYDALDAAIELAPQADFPLLNRGMALHYAGRSELALRDLEHYYRRDTLDPYRVIWLYLVQRQLDPATAQQRLRTLTPMVRPGWGQTMLYYLDGQIDANRLLALAEQPWENREGDPANRDERLCEAYFYIGQQALIAGDDATAANFFRLAVASNIYEFVEHNFALFELRLLEQQQQDALAAAADSAAPQ